MIREKVAAVIAGKHFMAVLSDGSQARKTGNEKELVLVRTEKEGLPVYYVVSLLEMADFGGCDAESLKAGLDSVFENGYEVKPAVEQTILTLEEMKNEDDDTINSFLRKFNLSDENNLVTVVSEYPKAGHE